MFECLLLFNFLVVSSLSCIKTLACWFCSCGFQLILSQLDVIGFHPSCLFVWSLSFEFAPFHCFLLLVSLSSVVLAAVLSYTWLKGFFGPWLRVKCATSCTCKMIQKLSFMNFQSVYCHCNGINFSSNHTCFHFTLFL